MRKVREDCKCGDFEDSIFIFDSDCQLTLDKENDKAYCKPEADNICRVSVASLAAAYRNAENANDPQCYDKDPMYRRTQETWASCSKGKNLICLN